MLKIIIPLLGIFFILGCAIDQTEKIVNSPDNYLGKNVSVSGTLDGSGDSGLGKLGIKYYIRNYDGFKILLKADVKNEIYLSGKYNAYGTLMSEEVCKCEWKGDGSPNWVGVLDLSTKASDCDGENPHYRCSPESNKTIYYILATSMKRLK